MRLNSIYQGDNLYFMADMPEESFDLIYIDPPFGTESLWKSHAFKEKVQELQFYDIWGGGVNGYVEFMVERLRYMYRLLKPTGSLFVHLDWRMSHYIKIELDKIFGVRNPAAKETNFRNEIIWCYKSGGAGKKRFARKHDTILFYAKNWKRNLEKFQIERIEKSYQAPGSGMNPAQTYYEDQKGRYTLVYPKDWWDDIGMISTAAKHSLDKRTKWPTQKPVRLLMKIINATTQPEDLVGDFFCGCGTTMNAAQELGRNWVGIDASQTACETTRKKMITHHSLYINIETRPLTGKDFSDLPPFEFEKAAVRYIGGVTNHAQVADGGIDGRLAFDGTPIQAKKESSPVGDTDRFRGFYLHLKQHGRGVYISHSGYTKPAKERAAGWRNEGLDIQLLTVKDILQGKYREQPLETS